MTSSAEPALVPPYPLTVGDVVSGSFRALFRRPALYFGLTFLGAAVSLVLLFVVSVLVILVFRDRLTTHGALDSGFSPALVWLPLLAFLAVLVATLAQAKAGGMLARATVQLAEGQPPRLRELWSGTRGFLPRIVSLVLLLWAVVLVVFVAFALLLSLAFAGSNGASPAGILVGVLVVLVAIPVTVFLAIRWLYVTPVLAVEGARALDGVRRSWRLTAGRFWPTLGYLLMAALLVWVVEAVVMLPVQLAGVGRIPVGERGAMTTAEVTALITGVAVSYGLGLLVGLITGPFTAAYLALMYLDARRRLQGVGFPPPAWQPPQPSGWQPPGVPGPPGGSAV